MIRALMLLLALVAATVPAQQITPEQLEILAADLRARSAVAEAAADSWLAREAEDRRRGNNHTADRWREMGQRALDEHRRLRDDARFVDEARLRLLNP